MQAVVLAGGLATRMRPRTLTVPKAMLEVAGRPFVDWQLEKLRDCGFDDVVLCVAFLAEQIRDHVGDGGRYGVKVRYSDEGATLLGTAGAIRKGLDLLAPTFLITYGDSYLPFDYASPLRVLDAHADCAGVMSIFENRGAWDMSNVEADAAGEWIVRYEKGRPDLQLPYIDYGAIALRREIIAELPPGVPRGLDVIQTELARQKRLRAVVARDRFFEIGSPEGLSTLDQLLASK
ncbi:MAG: sugar phosphate nucleotidyltransferase [Polyangiaceae bacterium]|jgi:N-acetyl-alpha-D-muramate 1-phosphate uridylyltransferase